MSQLYRPGKLGEALVDALEELIKEEKITEALAIEVLSQFDRSVARVFEEQVTAKATLKGNLDSYRYIDNVWTFIAKDFSMRVAPTLNAARRDEENIEAQEPVKLVLVDSKVVKFEGEEDDEAAGQ